MKLKPKITIADHFGVIEDPRIDRTKCNSQTYCSQSFRSREACKTWNKK